jgi:hypothetical protein
MKMMLRWCPHVAQYLQHAPAFGICRCRWSVQTWVIWPVDLRFIESGCKDWKRRWDNALWKEEELWEDHLGFNGFLTRSTRSHHSSFTPSYKSSSFSYESSMKIHVLTISQWWTFLKILRCGKARSVEIILLDGLGYVVLSSPGWETSSASWLMLFPYLMPNAVLPSRGQGESRLLTSQSSHGSR